VTAGPERLVAIGAAAPGDAQETVVSPDQAPTAPAAPPPRQRRRWWPWALAAIPIVALAVVVALVLANSGDDGAGPEARTTAKTANTTPETPPMKTVTLEGSRPNNIVLARGKAWVVRSGNPRLAVIDAETVERLPYSPRVGDAPAGEAAGFGKLWVVNQSVPSLIPIGLSSHRQEGAAVPLPDQGKAVAVATSTSAIWVGIRGNPGLLLRIDPNNRQAPAKTIELPDGLQNIAVGAGAVWVIARRANTVTRVDIASGNQRPIFVGKNPFGIAYGRGAVWVTNNGDDTVTRIDSGSLNTTQIGVGRGPKGIAVGAGAIWVADSIASTVTRIDPELQRADPRPIDVATNPYAVDTFGKDVWVTSPPTGKVQRITP
jgi:YVTN family beta-propeller protein